MARYTTFALLVLLAAPVLGADFPRGQLVEEVACAETPAETYALYLPSGYTPERAWPVLYILDPRARGNAAAERFLAGAEKYGYILASSYSTMSDGPLEPNLKAMRAIWVDTHARFNLDARRAYAAGFSGTVRSCCVLARAAPGTLAGVIGAGAGFPFQQPPKKGDPFVFNRAAAHARKGDRRKALADLRKAVDKGWTSAAAIEKEEAFAGLQGEAGYKEIVKSLGAGSERRGAQ